MAKTHGGTHHKQGVLHRGGPKPEATTAPYHVGSGAPKTTHAAPTLPQVNDQNYSNQRVRRGKR